MDLGPGPIFLFACYFLLTIRVCSIGRNEAIIVELKRVRPNVICFEWHFSFITFCHHDMTFR